MSRPEDSPEDLKASEERDRLLVEGVKDYAIFMLDPNGHVVSWNAGAERITGYQADEIFGRHFSCFYPAAEVAHGKPGRTLEAAIADGPVRRGRLAGPQGRLPLLGPCRHHRPPRRRGPAARLRENHQRLVRAQAGRRSPAVGPGPRDRRHHHHRRAGDGPVVQPGRREDLRLPGRRGPGPERQDADARAVPRRARRLPRQLRPHRAGEDHRHRPRGGRPAERRLDLPDGPGRQRIPAQRPPLLHRHRPRHHRAEAAGAGAPQPPRRTGGDRPPQGRVPGDARP